MPQRSEGFAARLRVWTLATPELRYKRLPLLLRQTQNSTPHRLTALHLLCDLERSFGFFIQHSIAQRAALIRPGKRRVQRRRVVERVSFIALRPHAQVVANAVLRQNVSAVRNPPASGFHTVTARASAS